MPKRQLRWQVSEGGAAAQCMQKNQVPSLVPKNRTGKDPVRSPADVPPASVDNTELDGPMV